MYAIRSYYAFCVYIYLYYAFENFNFEGKVRFSKIARKCNMSINTAQKAVQLLIDKGLLAKKRTYKHCNGKNLIASNYYTIKPIEGGYGLADKNICNNIKDNSAFMIYCFIVTRANKHGYSFPKYREISEATKLSRATVINKIKDLNELLFLRKKRRWRIDGRCLSNEHWVSLYSDIFEKPRIKIRLKKGLKDLFESMYIRLICTYKSFKHTVFTYFKNISYNFV